MKLSWWGRFISEWKRSMCAPIIGIYATDKYRWVCSCAAFMNNEFLICKHLVNGSCIPIYRELRRMGTIPFLSFEFCENRRFPYINREYKLVTAAPLMVLSPPTVNFNLDPSADQTFDSSIEMTTSVRNLLEWFQSHINDLEKDGTSPRQIELIHKNIMKNAYEYREAVSREYSSRMAGPTWKKNTTLFLK